MNIKQLINKLNFKIKKLNKLDFKIKIIEVPLEASRGVAANSMQSNSIASKS